MLKGFVNRKYLSKVAVNKIRDGFKKSKPYPHFVLDGFFDEAMIKSIKNALIKEEYEKVEKDLFSLSHTKDLVSSKNSEVKKLHSLLCSKEFIILMEKLTGLKLANKIDMQSHKMVQGDYLLFHDDELEGRKIAYIVYLSDFKQSDGGKLRLYDIKKPINPVSEIMPKFNRFACFKVSKKSLHDVEEVKTSKQRLTIGGWVYGN